MKFVKASPDNSTLHPILRSIGRKRVGWNHKKIPFCGCDIWNAYEFSFLLQTGKPVNKILRIEYPVSSTNIVESKSLKLYLNSYNMVKFANIQSALACVKNDLEEILGTSGLKLSAIGENQFTQEFTTASSFKNINQNPLNDFIDYEYNSDILRTKTATNNKYFIKTNLLKSNCPLTGQPDWGTVYIYYKSNKKLLEKSFLRYIISFRRLGEYHEECCERILYDLTKILQPIKLIVFCKYTRRGGIDINPIRIYPTIDNYLDMIPKNFKKIIYTRDFRQ